MATEPASTASLIVPLLALVVILAVDSVQEDDSVKYRLFVGVTGVGSIGPIMIVLAQGAFGSEPRPTTGFYTVVSIILITFLIVGTSMVETSRGLEDDRDKWIFTIVGGVILVLWYGLLAYLG